MRENEGLSQKEIETQIQDSFKPKECNSDYDDITIVGVVKNLETSNNQTVIYMYEGKVVSNIDLNDYPEIVDCLERNTSLEPRAVNFFIKDGKKEIFKNLLK